MLKNIFLKVIFLIFIIENTFSRINDYSIIDSLTENENILSECISTIQFPSNYINSETNNEVIIDFCVESSFLENGLFFYLSKSSNYKIPKKNLNSNENLLYDQNLNTVKLISSILYSFSESSEKNTLPCLSESNFTFNGVEFSLLMNECINFFKENRGKNIYFQILISDFPFPENAFKYELIIHLENYENKNYISIISYTFIKIFEKDDIIISSGNDNQCGILTTYLIKIKTKNILFDNYDKIIINVELPLEKFIDSSLNKKSLFNLYRNNNIGTITGNKEIVSNTIQGISYLLKYSQSDFIEFTIDNIWSPLYNNTLNEMKISIQLPPYEEKLFIGITSNSNIKIKNNNYNFYNDYYLKCDCHGNDISKFKITSNLYNTVTKVELTLKTLSYFPSKLYIEIYFPLQINVLDSTANCNNVGQISLINSSSFNFTNFLPNNNNQNKTFTCVFSSLKLSNEIGEDSIKIKYNFWENNKLINAYYNEENIIQVISPNLNVNIELENYFDFTQAKIILKPGMRINESCYILLSLPKEAKFYSLSQTICSEKNDNNLLCSFYDFDDNGNEIIKISNLKKIKVNEEYQFYIKYLINYEYIYEEEHIFNIVHIFNNKNKLFNSNQEKIIIMSKVNKPKLFNSSITTKNTFESTLYTFESEINSELDINGMLYFRFSEIYNMNNNLNIDFYINNKKCTNYKYLLNLPNSILINDFSNCFNNEIISSSSIKFFVKIQNLMSPRMTKEIKVDYYYADSKEKILEYSNNTIKTENNKVIKQINIIPNSFETYSLTTYEIIFINENYLYKNEIIVISSDYKFYFDETDEIIDSYSNSKPLNDFVTFLTTDVIKDSGSNNRTYKLFLKLNKPFEINEEIKFTLKNIQNPHSEKEVNFKIEIYDSSINYIIEESNLIPINYISKLILSNLTVTRTENNTFNFKFSPTKLIEAYDMFELKFNKKAFGINLSGLYCQINIIQNINHEFGCINEENGKILFPWGYKSLRGIFNSSYIIEFDLLYIFFKHTEGIEQTYNFEFNILDKDMNIKERGKFEKTITYDCYYTCEKCDKDNKSVCITCNDDYPYINDVLGECFNSCPIGYNLNIQNGFCYQCNPDSNCEECDENNINKCIKCPSNLPILINDTCHEFCPIGEFKINGICTNINEYIKENVPDFNEDDDKIKNKNKNNDKNNTRNNNNENYNIKEKNDDNNYYKLHLKYELNKRRGNLESLRLNNDDNFPFDYYIIPIIIIIIIGINYFFLWRNGIEYNFSGYILFELSILFKIILISLYILTFMTGEKLLFYGYSIILTVQYFISLSFFVIYDFIYGFKTNLFSIIISIIFDYKVLKIDLRKRQNNNIYPLPNNFIYFVYSIYICDIVLINFSSILFGTYLSFIIKDYKYIYNLIQYSIILSIIIFYFLTLDIIIPKNNKKLPIKKIDINKIPKLVLNEFTTLKSQISSTERFKVDTNLQFPTQISISKFNSNTNNNSNNND